MAKLFTLMVKLLWRKWHESQRELHGTIGLFVNVGEIAREARIGKAVFLQEESNFLKEADQKRRQAFEELQKFPSIELHKRF